MKSATIIILMGILSFPCYPQFPEKCLTNHPAEDRYATYSPDGNSILFESNRNGNWDIFLMDRDGKNVRALTSEPEDQRSPFWNPSGKSVVFESRERNELIELKLMDGSREVILSEKELNGYGMQGSIQFPRYAPRDALITFTLNENDTLSNIFIFDRKEKTLEEIFLNPYRTVYSSLNSKANRVIFHSRHETDNKTDEIYEINLKDNSIRRLTESTTHSFCPAYSAKDKLIAFAESMEDSRPEIFIMKRDGSEKTRITNNSDGDTLPSWGPSGKTLLISGYRNGNYEICEIDISELY
jgi:TolB protein